MDNKPSNQHKQILLVFRHAPYGSAIAREGLEAALACGAMGAKASLLYINDGVWQLLTSQQSDAINYKNQAAMTAALPLYGIEDIWIDQDSLDQRGIDGKEIEDFGKVACRAQVQELLSGSAPILSF